MKKQNKNQPNKKRIQFIYNRLIYYPLQLKYIVTYSCSNNKSNIGLKHVQNTQNKTCDIVIFTSKGYNYYNHAPFYCLRPLPPLNYSITLRTRRKYSGSHRQNKLAGAVLKQSYFGGSRKTVRTE